MSKARKMIIADERRPDLFFSDSSHLSGFPEYYAEKGDIFLFLSGGSSTPIDDSVDWKRGNEAIIKKLDENEIRHIRCDIKNDLDAETAYKAIEKITTEDQKITYKAYIIAINSVFSKSLEASLSFFFGDIVLCENANEIKSENRKKKKEEIVQKSIDEKKKKEQDAPARAPAHDGKQRHRGMSMKESTEATPIMPSEYADQQPEPSQKQNPADSKKEDKKTYYEGEPSGNQPGLSESSPEADSSPDKSETENSQTADGQKPKRTKSPHRSEDNTMAESERERKKIESTIAENIIPAEEAYSDSIGVVELAKIDYAKQLFLKIRDTLEGAVKGLKDAQLDDGLIEKYIAIIALSDSIDDFRDMWTTLEPGLQAASDVPKENFAKLKAICEYYKDACDLFESRAAKALD